MRIMCLGLEEYRARIGTWNARVSAVSGRPGRNARSENILGTDPVRDGYSNFISDWGSEVKPRTCLKRCENFVEWL